MKFSQTEMCGREGADLFELEGTDLQRHCIEIAAFLHHGGEGWADVPGSKGFDAACIEHQRDELCGRGLTVGAGDGDDGALAELP